MSKLLCALGFLLAVSGCQMLDQLGLDSLSSFTQNSRALVGGGAQPGKDYVKNLSKSEDARRYFAGAQPIWTLTVRKGEESDTGVVWTEDGGIVIPPNVTVQFSNKGYCLDPHLPAPKAGDEMQLVKSSALIPDQLRGTYTNLLQRAANGDSEVRDSLQRLVWALRTAGTDDAYANNLTERQKQILSECSDENGSFESTILYQKIVGESLDRLQAKVNRFSDKVNDALQFKVGDFTYNVSDLMDPDKAERCVGEHLQSLVAMSANAPVLKTGFNYGELARGVYTDIKGNDYLSFDAKIANSTSVPYTFYPMDYAAQVGSGRAADNYYAPTDAGMRQRITIAIPEQVTVGIVQEQRACEEWHRNKAQTLKHLLNELGFSSKFQRDSELSIVGANTSKGVAKSNWLGELLFPIYNWITGKDEKTPSKMVVPEGSDHYSDWTTDWIVEGGSTFLPDNNLGKGVGAGLGVVTTTVSTLKDYDELKEQQAGHNFGINQSRETVMEYARTVCPTCGKP